MNNIKKPHFIIKKNTQKTRVTVESFQKILTDEILADVCKKITNRYDYTVEFVDNDYKDEFCEKGYNKGRLAILLYDGYVNYVSFSEEVIKSRNSSVQSVPTAFNKYYNDSSNKKRLFYYFIVKEGNAETDYHLFIYRLMRTIGFKFLNIDDFISTQIVPYNSIDDIIYSRKNNKQRNKSNNSTYITKSDKVIIDIYGKTYGASKYESTLICYTASLIALQKQKVTLYEVLEKDLKELPKKCRDIINEMGVIDIVPTDMKLEKRVFNENNSLRSPRYIYNLFTKISVKKCAFCSCNIAESVQAAHVWPVAEIKKHGGSTFEQKLNWAIDGENALWLCNNHHTWFDKDIIRISYNGDILIDSGINAEKRKVIEEMTTEIKIPSEYLTSEFKAYLKKRYEIR